MPQAVILDVLEQEWMIAQFAQLHHSVHNGACAGRAADEETFLERTVQSALQLRHVALDDVLCLQRVFFIFCTSLIATRLLRQLTLDLLLETTQ